MIRHALESFLVAWRHVPGYRELSSRRTPLNTLVFAQCHAFWNLWHDSISRSLRTNLRGSRKAIPPMYGNGRGLDSRAEASAAHTHIHAHIVGLRRDPGPRRVARARAAVQAAAPRPRAADES